ncbi:MAG: type II toxin-antitoxin system RelE/ParE family toxin [Prevotellaceae bacterium]|jgi:plasmid stabilization system protein ParE|nr:type II toxin-antitoxin system RelE/ParE family toxin [Prevotellaceae bacterium]
MEVIWSKLSIDSVDSIITYVERHFGNKTAAKVYRKIISFLLSLSHTPRMGTVMPQFSQFGEIRRAVFKQNHIYYRIMDSQIELIIIWDGRQDPSRLYDMLIDYLTKNYE